MKDNKKMNSGFTLIELIIAMAILGLLMTAISSLMGTGVFNYKKTKADVRIQTASQDTYNRITDSIMQANVIVIGGWECAEEIPFSRSGETFNCSGLNYNYYVLNEDIKNKVIANPAWYGINSSVAIAESNVKLFSEIAAGKKLYVESIGIRRAMPIDINYVSSAGGSEGGHRTGVSKFTGVESQLTCNKTIYSGMAAEATVIEFDTRDTAVDSYNFSGEKIFYGVEYEYMDLLDDTYVLGDSTSEKQHEYTKSLSYANVVSGSGTYKVSGCVAEIDSENNSIDFKMYFNDRNATFTTDGKVNLRNSHIMNKK